jgi:DNA-binding MarR family transcriptional regulator
MRATAPPADAIARLLEQTARAIYENRGPKAVHPRQWAVLRFLNELPEEARSVSGVAVAMSVTRGPASRAIAALVRRKLAVMIIDKRDKRRRRLDLTPAGRTLLRSDPIGRLTSAIEELSARERTGLATILPEIQRHLDPTATLLTFRNRNQVR